MVLSCEMELSFHPDSTRDWQVPHFGLANQVFASGFCRNQQTSGGVRVVLCNVGGVMIQIAEEGGTFEEGHCDFAMVSSRRRRPSAQSSLVKGDAGSLRDPGHGSNQNVLSRFGFNFGSGRSKLRVNMQHL